MKIFAGSIEKVLSVEWIIDNSASLKVDLKITGHCSVDFGIIFFENGKIAELAAKYGFENVVQLVEKIED
jgi:hypothetical protein